MRAAVSSLVAVAGLLTPLTQASPIVTRADIESCLTTAGVPIDVKGTSDWDRDVAPFNIRVPYTPVAISVPRTIEQIQKSVICGKKLGIKVSAKSGGHSYASLGFGGEDGHLVVELDRMYNTTYSARDQVATVQPGARLGHLATELYTKYGRGIAHGTCPGLVLYQKSLHQSLLISLFSESASPATLPMAASASAPTGMASHSTLSSVQP